MKIFNFWCKLFRHKLEEYSVAAGDVYETFSLFGHTNSLDLYSKGGKFLGKIGYSFKKERGITLYVTHVFTTPLKIGKEEVLMARFQALDCSDTYDNWRLDIIRKNNRYTLVKSRSWQKKIMVSGADNIELIPEKYEPTFRITKHGTNYCIYADGGLKIA